MVKLVLVNQKRDIYPNLGLCYLSSYLKKNLNFNNISLIENDGFNKKLIHRILDEKPDIVGFFTLSILHPALFNASKILTEKGIRVIWGGPHITGLYDILPNFVDIGVIGEGEETVLELIKNFIENGRFENLERIDGICYYSGDNLIINKHRDFIGDLDTIPFPNRSILDRKWYLKKRRYLIMKGIYIGMTMITSRGCPFNCVFCQAKAQWGKPRFHSPEYVVEEIDSIRKDFPEVNAINIVDDLFIMKKERLRRIVDLILKKNLHRNIVFNVNGRVDLIDEEILDMLKSINVIQISYGFESGSDGILSYLKDNRITVEQNIKVAEMTNKFGIGVGGQFMIGTPGETIEDIKKTIEFIKNIKMSHAHLSITCPLPGTALWEEAKKKGLLNNISWEKFDFGNPKAGDFIYINETISKEDFKKIFKIVFKECENKTLIHNLRELIIVHGIFSLIKKAINNPLKVIEYLRSTFSFKK